MASQIRWKDFETITRQRQLSAAACDNTTLRETAMEIFLNQKLTKPVRLIGFGASNISDHHTQEQMGLFNNKRQSTERREKLSHVIDEIRTRFGDEAITNARKL